MQKFRPELFQNRVEVRGTVNGEFIQSRPCDELMTQPLRGRQYRKNADFDSTPAKLDQFSGNKSFGKLREDLDDVGDTAHRHGRSAVAKQPMPIIAEPRAVSRARLAGANRATHGRPADKTQASPGRRPMPRHP